MVAPLAARLGLDFYRANLLDVSDAVLTGQVSGPVIDRAAKAAALRQWAGELGLPLSRVAAMGDGANDLAMLAVAGLSIAFGAKPAVAAVADHAIDGTLLAALPLLRAFATAGAQSG
jgi:phosphoserine phosphatase